MPAFPGGLAKPSSSEINIHSDYSEQFLCLQWSTGCSLSLTPHPPFMLAPSLPSLSFTSLIFYRTDAFLSPPPSFLSSTTCHGQAHFAPTVPSFQAGDAQSKEHPRAEPCMPPGAAQLQLVTIQGISSSYPCVGSQMAGKSGSIILSLQSSGDAALQHFLFCFIMAAFHTLMQLA